MAKEHYTYQLQTCPGEDSAGRQKEDTGLVAAFLEVAVQEAEGLVGSC